MRKAGVVISLIAAVLLTGACSTRRIDPVSTGSQSFEGTSWQIFCDGPNAVIWVPGHSGDADEIEVYAYDHHMCAPDYYAKNPDAQPSLNVPDEDGINEDED